MKCFGASRTTGRTRLEKPPTHPPLDWSGCFTDLAARTRDPRLKAFYRKMPVSARTPITRVPLLALDLETTGLNHQCDAILSIGFIPVDNGRIHCRGARNWIVRPNLPVEKIAVTIHGITNSELKAAPRLADCFEALLHALAGRVIVTHCHEIERRFLQTASLILTGEKLVFPMIDTMAIEEKKHPHQCPTLIQRWFGKVDSPSLRLDACRARYGLPSYHPHHALTDALATAELFLAQMERYSPRTPVSTLWL